MNISRFLCVLLMLAPNTVPAADVGRELRSAQKALAAGDHARAFDEYRRFAVENGNPLAQFVLGQFYEQGWGRPKDRAEACRWFEQAAVGAIPTAAYFLGECLVDGLHRQAAPREAARWFRQAADLGHYYSLCSLAELYVRGNGVAREPEKGLAFCRQAAERGVVRAMHRMGRFRLEGDEPIRDPAAALQWFALAAKRNSIPAQYRLGLMLRDGQGQASDPAGARHWLETAAGQGYVKAYFPIAELYFNANRNPETGQWTAHDLAKTYMWLAATLKRSRDSQEREEAKHMLARVRKVMPRSWEPDLDARVAKHLASRDPSVE